MAFSNRYDPKTLDDLVLANPQNRVYLDHFVHQRIKGHLLMVGTNGTGKTSIANLIPMLTHGAQNFNLITVAGDPSFEFKPRVLQIWDRHISFSHLYNGPLFVIIDEIDKIKHGLPLLWQWMDLRKDVATVLVTTNEYFAVTKALRSRMHVLQFGPITAQHMLPRAREIMRAESVPISDQDLLTELQSVEHLMDVRKYMARLEFLALELRAQMAPAVAKPAPTITQHSAQQLPAARAIKRKVRVK